MRIEAVKARPILDSRSQWTIEVTLICHGHQATYSVPGGASTGSREATVTRDPDGSMSTAIKTIRRLEPRLVGLNLGDQSAFDQLLLKLDPSATKAELGGNVTLALSGAYLKLSALTSQQPLWRLIADLTGSKPDWPRLYANLINGGKHAPGLDIQEFMVVAQPVPPSQAITRIRAVYLQLSKRLSRQFGASAQLVGDEGGFAPSGATHKEVLDLLQELTAETSLELAIDAAATAFATKGGYHFEGLDVTNQHLAELYVEWARRYHLLSIEDPFAEDDQSGFKLLSQLKPNCLIIGDDITTTNAAAITEAAEANLIGGVIIKPNQIGTFSQTFAAIKAASDQKIKVIASHRSGETLDDSIADLAVGIGADGLKLGAPARGERVAKYNRLLKIEEEMNE